MSDFLKQMATTSKLRAQAVPVICSDDLDRPIVPLKLGGFDVIAEIKDRSPAEGDLAAAGSDRSEQAQRYATGGAAAISVLTEPSRFGGAVDHLEEVVAAAPTTPVMRKDFLVDPVQVLEARAAGASGVLLIVAMLSDTKLRAMLDCVREHKMFALIESFDRQDLSRLSHCLTAVDYDLAKNGQLLFGVNARNLHTLKVNADRLQELAARLPDGPCVAESGLHTATDVARVAAWGYSMALVGTALMRSTDPAALLKRMREAGAAELAA